MANVHTLSQVLEGCNSHDNEQRKACQRILDQQCQKEGVSFVINLLQEANGNNAGNRLAAVMSRRMLVKEERIQENMQGVMRKLCLQILSSPQTDFKQKKHVCDIVECMLGFDEFKFPELENFLQQTLNASDEVFKLTGLQLAKLTVESREPEDMNSFGNFIRNSLLSSVSNAVQSTNKKIMLGGLRVMVSIIQHIPDNIVNPEDMNPIDLLFHGLSTGLKLEDEKMCTDCLELIGDLAKSDFKLFESNLDQVIGMINQVALNPPFPDDMRSQALEVVVSLIQADPERAVQNSSFVEGSMALCFSLLSENDYDPDWGSLENSDTFTDLEELQQSAEVAIMNIVSAISGSNPLMNSLMRRISSLLNSNHWFQKHAGLVTIYQCLENLEEFGVKFKQIIDLVAMNAKDSNDRVRFAVCQCVGLLCSDYSRGVNSHATQIVEILSFYIEQDPHTRVRTHALLCWINFFDAVSPKCLVKNLKRIIGAFQTLLTSEHAQKQILQENLCASIAELCSALRDDHRDVLEPYFDSFMQTFVNITKSCNRESLAIEALRTMSYLGVIGGKQKFAPYVENMMKASSQLVHSETISEEKLFNCWSRISDILGDDFGVFLEDIVGLCVQAVESDVVMLESFTRDDDDNIEIGDKGAQLDANKVQLVKASLELLEELSKTCPNSFKQYIPNLVPVISKRMVFQHHQGIREAAIDCIVGGFCHCCIFVNEHSFVIDVVSQLLQIFRNEDKIQVKTAIITKLYNMMEENKETITGVIKGQNLKQINDVILELLCTANQRIEVIKQSLQLALKEDFTEDDLKDELTGEHTLTSEIASFYHLCFKLYGADLLALMSHSMSTLQEMLVKGHSLQQVTVLNIFSDIISLCDANGVEDFAKTLIPAFSNAVKTDDPDLRESAFYIILAILDKYPQLVKDKELCHSILQESFQQFQFDDDSRHALRGNFESVLDSAAAVIIKTLMRFDDSHLSGDAMRLYKLWLETCFPMRENEFCGRKIFDMMCELLERMHRPFVGHSFSNFPTIFKILVEHHGTDYMSNAADDKVVAILGQIRRDHQQLFMSTVQALDEDAQEQLEDLIEGTIL